MSLSVAELRERRRQKILLGSEQRLNKVLGLDSRDRGIEPRSTGLEPGSKTIDSNENGDHMRGNSASGLDPMFEDKENVWDADLGRDAEGVYAGKGVSRETRESVEGALCEDRKADDGQVHEMLDEDVTGERLARKPIDTRRVIEDGFLRPIDDLNLIGSEDPLRHASHHRHVNKYSLGSSSTRLNQSMTTKSTGLSAATPNLPTASEQPFKSDEPMAREDSTETGSGEVAGSCRMDQSWLSARAYLALAFGVLVRLAFCTALGERCIQSIVVPFVLLEAAVITYAIYAKVEFASNVGYLSALQLYGVSSQNIRGFKRILDIMSMALADFAVYFFSFIVVHILLPQD